MQVRDVVQLFSPCLVLAFLQFRRFYACCTASPYWDAPRTPGPYRSVPIWPCMEKIKWLAQER